MTQKESSQDAYKFSREGLLCKVSIAMEAIAIKAAFNKRLKELAARHRGPGFRPGKFPPAIIKAQHGDAILQEVAGEIADKTFQEALEKESIQVAGTPKVDLSEIELDKDITLQAEFECVPEVTLKELKKGAVKRTIVEADNKDVDDAIEKLLTENMNWQEKKGKSAKGDQLTLDYQGMIDQKAFDGGSADGVEITVGGGKMLPDFEAALVSVKAGDEKQFDVLFPKDYMQKDLANKKAVFTIKVHAVKKSKKPTLDADFFKKIGSDAENETGFRDEIAKKQTKESEWLQDKIRHKAVVEWIEKEYNFAVPSSMVEEEKKHISKTKPELSEEEATSQAEKNIRVSLVLQKIANEHNVSVNEKMIRAYLEKLAPDFIALDMFINWYQQDKERMTKVQVAVIEQEVVKKVLLQCGEKEDKISVCQAKAFLDIKE